MPSGPKPPWGSSHAGVTIASPALICVSHSSFCASEPAARIAPALSTELTKCSDASTRRPLPRGASPGRVRSRDPSVSPVVAVALPRVVVGRGRQRDLRLGFGTGHVADADGEVELDPTAPGVVDAHVPHGAVE